MAGRYPGDNKIARHPAYQQGQESAERDEDFHNGKALELRPEELSEAEGKVWDRIAPQLSRLGRLKPHYVDFVEEYCVVKARMDSARAFLDEKQWAYVTTGRHGRQYKARPQVAQLNDDWRKWNSLVAQLGISPATELRFNDRQGSLFDDDDFGSI